MAAMYRISRDKGLTMAELLDMSPYDLTLEWLGREAWLSECARHFRKVQSGEQPRGQHRYVWSMNG
jgi:hypothetical protein